MFPNQGQPDGDIYTTGLRVVVPNDEFAGEGQTCSTPKSSNS